MYMMFTAKCFTLTHLSSSLGLFAILRYSSKYYIPLCCEFCLSTVWISVGDFIMDGIKIWKIITPLTWSKWSDDNVV